MSGAAEQPGRERPHPRTPDPDPRVGSGVAHVPTADEVMFTDLSTREAFVCRASCEAIVRNTVVLTCAGAKAASLRSAGAFHAASGLDRACAQRRTNAIA